MNKVGDNGYLTTKGRTTIKMFSDKSVEDTGFSMRFEGRILLLQAIKSDLIHHKVKFYRNI